MDRESDNIVKLCMASCGKTNYKTHKNTNIEYLSKCSHKADYSQTYKQIKRT